MGRRRVLGLCAIAWLAWAAPAGAQEGLPLALEASRFDMLARQQGEARAHALLLQEFAGFLGPRAGEALLLLRRGRPVEMASPAGGGAEPSSVRVAGPRHPMDWSDIGL
ncbi:MAG: hypothetical protein AABZ64_02230, partial [Nitrospinota bacterium]